LKWTPHLEGSLSKGTLQSPLEEAMAPPQKKRKIRILKNKGGLKAKGQWVKGQWVNGWAFFFSLIIN